MLRWLHVLSASLWLGGLTVSLLTWIGWLRARETDAPQAVALLRWDRRVRIMLWIALQVLLATGIFNYVLVIMRAGVGTQYHMLIASKFLILLLMAALFAVDHVVFFRKRLMVLQTPESPRSSAGWRSGLRGSIGLGAANLVLASTALYLVLTLHGGPR